MNQYGNSEKNLSSYGKVLGDSLDCLLVLTQTPATNMAEVSRLKSCR